MCWPAQWASAHKGHNWDNAPAASSFLGAGRTRDTPHAMRTRMTHYSNAVPSRRTRCGTCIYRMEPASKRARPMAQPSSSWVPVPAAPAPGADFSIANIPFGIIRPLAAAGAAPRPATAIGDMVCTGCVLLCMRLCRISPFDGDRGDGVRVGPTSDVIGRGADSDMSW